jgi:hypothetical protein
MSEHVALMASLSVMEDKNFFMAATYENFSLLLTFGEGRKLEKQ